MTWTAEPQNIFIYIWKSCEIHPCTPYSLGSPQQKGLLRSIAPSLSHVGWRSPDRIQQQLEVLAQEGMVSKLKSE